MPFDGRLYERRDDVLGVLLRARERIARPGGWCRYAPSDGKGGYCVFGAVAVESGFVVTDTDMARDALRILSHLSGGSISEYNDADGRTQAEVVELFDGAIALRMAALTGGMEL